MKMNPKHGEEEEMCDFVKEFKKEYEYNWELANSEIVSENGGKVYKMPNNSLLNLFATAGNRNREYEIGWMDSLEKDYEKAYDENPQLAANLCLYTRDIRNGGIGEREKGRAFLSFLIKKNPTLFKNEENLKKIVNCGRWDDIVELYFMSNFNEDILNFLQKQLVSDIISMFSREPVSLLAKWMPSINTSSERTKAMARELRKRLELFRDDSEYRKTLTALRKSIDVVESKISRNKWKDVIYPNVPALAMRKYFHAFKDKDNVRFDDYLSNVEDGTEKVNASTLYPYDIIQTVLSQGVASELDEAQWRNLPNFVDDNSDVLVMADTSGSMSCDSDRPLATSIGLAIYFAEHNNGNYHNMFMTFSRKPSLICLEDNDKLAEKMIKVIGKRYCENTDLDAAFEKIHEIDSWCQSKDVTGSIVSKWKKKFCESGLRMPKLILWNVEATKSIASFDDDVAYISGYGIGSFKNLQMLIDNDAQNAMELILSQPQFSFKF